MAGPGRAAQCLTPAQRPAEGGGAVDGTAIDRQALRASRRPRAMPALPHAGPARRADPGCFTNDGGVAHHERGTANGISLGRFVASRAGGSLAWQRQAGQASQTVARTRQATSQRSEATLQGGPGLPCPARALPRRSHANRVSLADTPPQLAGDKSKISALRSGFLSRAGPGGARRGPRGDRAKGGARPGRLPPEKAQSASPAARASRLEGRGRGKGRTALHRGQRRVCQHIYRVAADCTISQSAASRRVARRSASAARRACRLGRLPVQPAGQPKGQPPSTNPAMRRPHPRAWTSVRTANGTFATPGSRQNAGM